jgi:SAM-dependent methyltransferase
MRFVVNVIKKISKLFLYFVLNGFYFLRDYISFASKKDDRFDLAIGDFQPMLFDRSSTTPFDKHYIYHVVWALGILEELDPKNHFDFSSSLYFVTAASRISKIYFYDFRPANLQLRNIECQSGDLNDIKLQDNSIHSVSCMHVVEHIGLGRYGDQLDKDGDLRAIAELRRIVAVGGILLFVVPIGRRAIIKFNANRIYTYRQIVSYFPEFDIVDFTLITDYGIDPHFISVATELDADAQSHGCGCFKLRKKLI